MGDRAGLATTLNNIGMVYQGTGQREQALEYFSKALPIMEEVGDRFDGDVLGDDPIGAFNRSVEAATAGVSVPGAMEAGSRPTTPGPAPKSGRSRRAWPERRRRAWREAKRRWTSVTGSARAKSSRQRSPSIRSTR